MRDKGMSLSLECSVSVEMRAPKNKQIGRRGSVRAVDVGHGSGGASPTLQIKNESTLVFCQPEFDGIPSTTR